MNDPIILILYDFNMKQQQQLTNIHSTYHKYAQIDVIPTLEFDTFRGCLRNFRNEQFNNFWNNFQQFAAIK